DVACKLSRRMRRNRLEANNLALTIERRRSIHRGLSVLPPTDEGPERVAKTHVISCGEQRLGSLGASLHELRPGSMRLLHHGLRFCLRATHLSPFSPHDSDHLCYWRRRGTGLTLVADGTAATSRAMRPPLTHSGRITAKIRPTCCPLTVGTTAIRP